MWLQTTSDSMKEYENKSLSQPGEDKDSRQISNKQGKCDSGGWIAQSVGTVIWESQIQALGQLYIFLTL